MAETQRTDLLGRLADLSEGALQKLSEAPGGDRIVGVMNTMRDRLDDLQRRVRGLEELEQRVAVLESRVDALSGTEPAVPTPARKTTETKTSSAPRAAGAPRAQKG